MGDTFVWLTGHAGNWNDPSNWVELSGTRSVSELERLGPFAPNSVTADRAPGAGDDVVFPAITVGGPVTGGGAADTVVLAPDGGAVTLAGTGTEHYAFRQLFVGETGSNLVLSNALLDTQATYVPDFAFLDVSSGAVGTDPDGRPYTASLGALTLEAIPGASTPGLPPGGRLILGDHDVDVTSLVQGALGVGNSFDPHADLIGSGAIHFPAVVSPAQPFVTVSPFSAYSLSVSGRPPALDHLDFGTIHVGESETLTFTVTNFAGGAALPLIGAVQTAVNDGHATDPALSGSGVTPGNFYLPPDLVQQEFSVTLTGDTPHSLDSQAVHLAFAIGSDASGITLPITGTVVEAAPPPPPTEIDWNALAAQVTANFEATGQWFL
jgi:hypothetical protein